MSHIAKNYITVSSGNVFADLNLPNPEERLDKSKVACKIYRLYIERYLNHLYTASILGIPVDKIEDLIGGKLSLFTVEELNNYWEILNDKYPSG